ncbi:interleukin-1 receptor-associated kinase 1-binding protein 1 homolog [Lethenteron reissneri]|uniref:interleukin-1 receptor-associated kinase 1-binding protein 1 homolog n=1 Tax=Lethenteron reissneri TaxID=7753 RepID=UPI002AB6A30C|nr:interleukin-1 receptor-associated kinase 1-binding protein 1 homolog [Lethenteron reissneri]
MAARVFATLMAAPMSRGSNPVVSSFPPFSSSSSCPASPPSRGREVRVVGRAELRGAPDRARLSVRVRSAAKREARSAERSAVRRAEYVESSVRRARGVQDDDVTVLKSLDRLDGLYVMTVEVVAEFSDFQAMHAVRNQLVEKLDSCVDVAPPVYHLTALARDNYRRQACLLAVASARRKAHEVCRLLGLFLGRPLSVHELPAADASTAADDDGDWPLPVVCSARREHGLASSSAADQNAAVASSSLRDHVEAATESVRSGVAAVFELRPPKRAGAEGRRRR